MIESVPNINFPFKSVLSLKLLIEYWENAVLSGKVPFGEPLLAHIRNAPELKEPITDLSILDKHRDLIDFLMSAAIAPAEMDKELTAATVPFQLTPIFETHAFNQTIDLPRFYQSGVVNPAGHEIIMRKTIQACRMILQQFYGVDLNIDKPITFTTRDPQSGLDRVYRVDFGRQFCEIINKGPLQPIDPKILKFLTEKAHDVDLWLQYVRPENFEFHGFVILRMTDITEHEMVSSIKYDLLEKDAVSRTESFIAIQHKLRSLFGLPQVRLGLAYFDAENNITVSSDQQQDECWKSLADQEGTSECRSYQGSVYERSWAEKRYIAVDNLELYPYKSKVEEALLSNGIRSVLLAPLIESGETIGMLELATPNPGELNSTIANKVESVLPMFVSAVKRVKEESITEIRAIIQEECTNIHPVVQWRFLEAGKRVLEKRRKGEPATFEDIIFKDVYPLFGMADIRNSSLERTLAIQEDLLENLNMAKNLLQKMQRHMPMPVLDEILFKLDVQLDKISYGLGAGDESSALEFLKREIHSLFAHFEDEPEFKEDIERYRSNLDPVFGVVYRRRRDFESSLGMINNMISNYLNEAQVTAQEMFPHYFEKYQTDGVEYTMYLGTSLTRSKKFNLFFLKNFRLWQLLLSCEIEKRMGELKPRLPIPLDITQLILVHDQALAIRFRPDEKQFDVDGAYDIRYEIIKKRIDKATIRQTGERLTQPGKIAIIYNQQKVQQEYKRYFEYLASKQVIHDNIEDLELDELPGATGLRALRVEIVHAESTDKQGPADLLKDFRTALQLQ